MRIFLSLLPKYQNYTSVLASIIHLRSDTGFFVNPQRISETTHHIIDILAPHNGHSRSEIEVDAPIAGRTPHRSVREVLNHTAFKPDLVIRVMYRQGIIYQDPCTGRAKNYQDCVQPKQSIIRVVYR